MNKLTDLLWIRMTEIYGHKWVSSYGTEPTRPWIEVINSLSQEQIKNGLNQLLKNGEAWPPNLMEFSKLCKSKPVRKDLCFPSAKAVTHQRESTRQIRTIEMEKIRGLL